MGKIPNFMVMAIKFEDSWVPMMINLKTNKVIGGDYKHDSKEFT
jgi:hypothetical protein